jgi:hypothetical protein
MKFQDWYASLPTRAQELIKRYTLNSKEEVRRYVIDMLKDMGVKV